MGVLRAAFNALTSMHGRRVTLKRLGTPDLTTSCRITPSNFFRNLEGPSETIIHGREFIIPIDSILVRFPAPYIRRNDRFTDADFGTLTIKEIEEIYDFGGDILGYRVRCE